MYKLNSFNKRLSAEERVQQDFDRTFWPKFSFGIKSSRGGQSKTKKAQECIAITLDKIHNAQTAYRFQRNKNISTEKTSQRNMELILLCQNLFSIQVSYCRRLNVQADIQAHSRRATADTRSPISGQPEGQ